jgi:hypothetical protein
VNPEDGGSTLIMTCKTILHLNPEDCNQHVHCRENTKSRISLRQFPSLSFFGSVMRSPSSSSVIRSISCSYLCLVQCFRVQTIHS